MSTGRAASLRKDDDVGLWPDDSDRRMEAALYELGVRGRLGPALAAVLDEFDIVPGDGRVTRLRVWVVDQSSLYDAIRTVSSLGLELIWVAPVDGP